MKIEFLTSVAVIAPDPPASRELYVGALGLPLESGGDDDYHHVADAAEVSAAASELEQAGHELLHQARQEPWGQTVARLQSPEGAIIGISYAPALHDDDD